MASESIQRECLHSELFEAARDRYIESNKPDPLSRKQLEGWSLRWADDTVKEAKNLGNDDDFLPDPSHILHGMLEIEGEYLVLMLKVTCSWKTAIGNESSPQQHGNFFFSCHATARNLTESELKNRPKIDNDADRKVQDKIRSKMVARLRDDAYISKLLGTNDSSSQQEQQQPASAKVPTGRLLAEAKIKYSANVLEERVRVSEDVCEAIRRAVWSSAESPLDVIEFILQLPFLPTTEWKSQAATLATTQLANRAQLRLLEDAMCDACEKEGDGEMLDDLKISDGEGNPPDVEDGKGKEDPSWKTAPSKKKKSDRESRKKQKSI